MGDLRQVEDVTGQIIGQNKISRRQLLGMGLSGMTVLAGGLSMTHKGHMMTSTLVEELGREVMPVKHKPRPETWSDNTLSIAWLGHAGFMLNFFGTRILFDPGLEERIGITPLGDVTIGPKRYMASPLKAEEVGPVDLLLVSHAHTDHFDYPTLRKVQSPELIAVTAKNTTPLWEGLKLRTVSEMHWGESKYLAGVEVKAIEGRHWGARLPWNKGMEANSYLLSKNGVNVFFSGDTGYTEKFRDQLQGIPIDVAIMGIAAYSPKSFEPRHCTPEQAWQMTEEIGAKKVIPMHWGTFRLSQEPMEEPIVRFRQAAQGDLEKIALQETGETWVMPR